jgi:glycosyltransferase involved in cell wall biosynthesis
VYLNGRFLTQRLTGVQRAASSTVQAIDGLLGSGELHPASWQFELLTPHGGAGQFSLQHIPIRQVGAMTGHGWEQLELPWHSRSGVLVSLANAAPLIRRRQCVTIHDASVFSIPQAYSRAFRTWYRIMLPGLGRRAGRIITDSRFSRDELGLRAGIPKEKIRVVPLGGEHILSVAPDETVFARHGLGARPFVLSVGSQSPHKNFRALWEAASHLDAAAYDLVVVGGNNPRVFGKAPVAGQNRIKSLGYVTDAELRALYSRAGCFVYPSLYEGFGLPPLEAMLCGCPVVVSRAASLPEVCGDAAIYCDPSDPKNIAESIARVMDSAQLRDQLRCKGLERAREFTWERSARALVNVLAEAWTA